MSRWIVHIVVAATCVQVGCQPDDSADPGDSSAADMEIDGTRLVRLGPRVHVAPVFTGTAVWNYPNGKRHTARTFKNGILDGPMVSWYDDGQTKLYAVTYKANKKEGMATGYYQDGKKKYEISYTKGVRHNVETWWHKNGQKQYEYEWAQGKRLRAAAWDDKGAKVALPKPKRRVPLRQPGRRPPVKGGSGSSTNRTPSKAKQPPSKTKTNPNK